MIDRRTLNPEECRLVFLVMGEKGKTQTELGKVLGNDHSQMSRKLRGKIELSYDEAQRIYTFLGQDERIKFLIDIRDDPSSEQWRDLFRGYTNPLEQIYMTQPFEVRARILEDLKGLNENYSKK